MMEPENLKSILRERVHEFGKKPAYVLSSEELATGIECDIFETSHTEDCGDGTVITKVSFEGNLFLCITEKNKTTRNERLL